MLARLRQQIAATADPVLEALSAELHDYPPPGNGVAPPTKEHAGVLIPLQFITDRGVLSFLSTTTIFGTPVDITLSELAIESFFPADPATAELLVRAASEAAGAR